MWSLVSRPACVLNRIPRSDISTLRTWTVYDVTSRESFNALPTWFNELDTFTNNPEIVKIIVGNKVDKESTRVVTTDEGKAFADKQGCLFVECNAKKGQKVKDAFDELVHQVSWNAWSIKRNDKSRLTRAHMQIISTPSLWQKTEAGQRRPGDRLPGTLPNDRGSQGLVSLTGGYVGYGVGVAKDNCSC